AAFDVQIPLDVVFPGDRLVATARHRPVGRDGVAVAIEADSLQQGREARASTRKAVTAATRAQLLAGVERPYVGAAVGPPRSAFTLAAGSRLPVGTFEPQRALVAAAATVVAVGHEVRTATWEIFVHNTSKLG